MFELLCGPCFAMMKNIKSNPEGGSGQHHRSYILFQEAVDGGCLICKRLERRINLQQLSAYYPEPGLTMSYDYKSETIGNVDDPGLCDGTIQLWLALPEIDDVLRNVSFTLVPIQSEDNIATLRHDDDESLEKTNNVVAESLKAFTTGFPECLALGTFWLQKCIQQHTTCDRPALVSAEEMRPSCLIDVGTFEQDTLRLCLRADFPAYLRYATLSHCWGVIQDRVHLTQRCLEAWQTVIPNEALMSTFKDAVIVTRNLGMRYLWIDSLCIIQDSKSDWLYESSRMSNVYKYAHCNIAATASEGCLRHVQDPRSSHRPSGTVRFYENLPRIHRKSEQQWLERGL